MFTSEREKEASLASYKELWDASRLLLMGGT